MQKNSRADKTHEFTQIGQEHYLKVTPHRVAIYQQLINSDTHPTADDIYQIVRKIDPDISHDTVSRTLLTFAKIGIVDEVETFGGAKRFDPNVVNHHYLHCTQCGRVVDFYNRNHDNLEV
jgi:Fur family peroxide stress response transcriptional regulator